MKFLYKMERKYGKFAVKNLSAYMASCFVISYVLQLLFPTVYTYMVFSPVHIYYNHEFWRFFTWIFTTPGSFDIFSLIMIFFYYSIGQSIERGIGTFMYNLYVFGTLILITVLQAIVWTVMYFAMSDVDFVLKAIALDGTAGASFMTYYMTTSVFLGFALLYQEAMVLLFLLIPFKVKWMAVIDGMFLLYYFIKLNGITSRLTIIAIVINFVLYYLVLQKASNNRRGSSAYMRTKNARTARQRTRSSDGSNVIEFSSKSGKPSNITRHKCAVCGRSEKDGIELEFRFCSKCNGNYEYCQDHLYTHEHVK